MKIRVKVSHSPEIQRWWVYPDHLGQYFEVIESVYDDYGKMIPVYKISEGKYKDYSIAKELCDTKQTNFNNLYERLTNR